jgi:hypothetical protein
MNYGNIKEITKVMPLNESRDGSYSEEIEGIVLELRILPKLILLESSFVLIEKLRNLLLKISPPFQGGVAGRLIARQLQDLISGRGG